jgi:hypothetical protein
MSECTTYTADNTTLIQLQSRPDDQPVNPTLTRNATPTNAIPRVENQHPSQSPQPQNKHLQISGNSPEAIEPTNNNSRTQQIQGTVRLSEHNIINNIPTGDLMSAKSKSSSSIRIYYQNINGIKKPSWADWEEAAQTINSTSIDIFGCAETNLAWTEELRKHAQSKIKATRKQANLSISTCIEPGATDYQPGGTCTCITGKYTGRIIEQITDKSGLGRWPGHLLIGHRHQHIAILTAYLPTKSDGFNTAYQQQWRHLRMKGITSPDTREQMLLDLQKVIARWNEHSFQVILMWDANERADFPKSKITKFMNNTSLAPLHNALPPASYARGSSCIDFIMATPGVHSASVAAGYTSFYDGVWHSDHRGIFVDIATHELFHSTTPNIAVIPRRLISS